MTETVASPAVKQNLPVAEEAQEELVYEFEVNLQRFQPKLKDKKLIQILELQRSILRKLRKVKRPEDFQRWFPRLHLKRKARSFSLQYFCYFNCCAKAQPGLLPSKEDDGSKRIYAQFC